MSDLDGIHDDLTALKTGQSEIQGSVGKLQDIVTKHDMILLGHFDPASARIVPGLVHKFDTMVTTLDNMHGLLAWIKSFLARSAAGVIAALFAALVASAGYTITHWAHIVKALSP